MNFWTALRRIESLWNGRTWQLLHCSVLVLALAGLGKAQNPTDSLTTAPNRVVLDSVAPTESKWLPTPRKALLLSLVLPGAGQIYNRRWWKVPLVFGAMGGIIYTIDLNQTNYRQFKQALEDVSAGRADSFQGRFSANTLRTLRDIYDRRTQLSYIGSVAVYGLIAIEAFVDAHLQDFDVDENLSLRLKPSFPVDPLRGTPGVGVGLVLQWNGPRPVAKIFP